MKILFMIGDPVLVRALRATIRESQDLTVCWRLTEYQFRKSLKRKGAADVCLLDLMMPWHHGYYPPEQPKDVQEGGIENAGIRCAGLIRAIKPDTKIIFLNPFVHGASGLEGTSFRNCKLIARNVKVIQKTLTSALASATA